MRSARCGKHSPMLPEEFALAASILGGLVGEDLPAGGGLRLMSRPEGCGDVDGLLDIQVTPRRARLAPLLTISPQQKLGSSHAATLYRTFQEFYEALVKLFHAHGSIHSGPPLEGVGRKCKTHVDGRVAEAVEAGRLGWHPLDIYDDPFSILLPVERRGDALYMCVGGATFELRAVKDAPLRCYDAVVSTTPITDTPSFVGAAAVIFSGLEASSCGVVEMAGRISGAVRVLCRDHPASFFAVVAVNGGPVWSCARKYTICLDRADHAAILRKAGDLGGWVDALNAVRRVWNAREVRGGGGREWQEDVDVALALWRIQQAHAAILRATEQRVGRAEQRWMDGAAEARRWKAEAGRWKEEAERWKAKVEEERRGFEEERRRFEEELRREAARYEELERTTVPRSVAHSLSQKIRELTGGMAVK